MREREGKKKVKKKTLHIVNKELEQYNKEIQHFLSEHISPLSY